MKKKNIILILTDQMRFDCIGVNKNNSIMTPFLDDLANQGVNCQNAFSVNPSCIAARASILTGLPAYKHGRYGYKDGVPWNYKNTLVTELSSRGYHTINVGKTHFYPQNNNCGFKVNKLYDPHQLDNDFISDYHQWLRDSKPHIEDPLSVYNNEGWPIYEWPAESYYHPTEWTLRECLEQIKACDQQPFFLQMSFHRPHPPFDPPNFYLKLYDDIKFKGPIVGDWARHHQVFKTSVSGRYGKIDDKYYRLMKKAYYAQITHIDYQVGKLVRFLQKNRLYDDTYIIFTSDHGEMLGDHHMLKKSVPFNAATRIPLIVRGSNIKPKLENKLITHIDIMATVLELIGDKNVTLDGINILSAEKRDILVGEHPSNKGWNFIIDGNYKYIWDSVKGEEWLFDFKYDKLEKYNLVNQDNETILKSMRLLLVNSFRKRNLTQFIDGESLKTGSILPDCDVKLATS